MEEEQVLVYPSAIIEEREIEYKRGFEAGRKETEETASHIIASLVYSVGGEMKTSDTDIATHNWIVETFKEPHNMCTVWKVYERKQE